MEYEHAVLILVDKQYQLVFIDLYTHHILQCVFRAAANGYF